MKRTDVETKISIHYGNKYQIVYLTFCLWSLILLCRPQDYFGVLSEIRPGLVSTVIMLMVMIMYANQIQGPSFFHEKQMKYYSALLLIMIVGIPTALYARLSFNTIFTEYIVTILYFFVFYKLVNSVSKLSTILFLGCLGSGVYLVISLFSLEYIAGRLYFGTMFDSNDLAYFSLVFLPFNLLFMRRNYAFWVRVACLLALGAGTLVILLSGSRGGLLAFVIALLILLTRTRTIKAPMKLLILLAVLVALVVAPINYARFATMSNLENDYNVQAETGRLAIWGIGIRTLLENPLTGVGVKNFPRAVGEDRAARDANTRRWQAAHNSLVQIGAETGFVGLFVFCLLSYNVVRIFKKVKIKATDKMMIDVAEMGLVGFAGMFVSSMFLSQAYSIYFVFYFAMSAIMNQMVEKY